MNKKIILVKLGGMILEDIQNLNFTISQLKTFIERDQNINNVVIIPGGGTIANFIRFMDKKLDIGGDLAHWEAILAMNWNGYQIHKNFPSLPLISQFSELRNCLNLKTDKKFPIIFLPFDYLRTNDILPHHWNVTSDSIAIYIAKKLELNECFLIKNIDGIYDNNNQLIKEISVEKFLELTNSNKLAIIEDNSNKLKQSTPIDIYSLKLIDKYKISCIILNGFYLKSRILEYFSKSQRDKKIYTKIYFNLLLNT